MYKTLVVALNAARQSLREPLFYILVVVFSGMIWASQFFTMFTLDEDLEGYLLREMGVSSIALCCALIAVLLSWQVITRDMERLTALTVLSKPVTRAQFLIGKYLGILAAVAWASVLLAFVLVLTLWQKEASPRIDELSDISEIHIQDYAREFTARVVSVRPVGDPRRPFTAVVRLDRARTEPRSALDRLAGAPDEGLCTQGILKMRTENDAPRQWRVSRSEVRDGATELTVLLNYPVRDASGALFTGLYDPFVQPLDIPWAGADAHITPSRAGAAQARLVRFWTLDAGQIARGAVLCVVRVAILAAFACSFAPHVPLVVTGAVSFVLFLLGHLSNYIFLALDSRGGLARIFGRILYTLLPNLENSRVESLIAAGREISMTYVLWTSAYGAAYTALVLLAGAAVFSRKEIR